MKKIFVLALGVLIYCQTNAQSEMFPLYYSQYGMNGTAAYIGKAGAIGALGGDIMAAQYNPAGLGLYRSHELTLSMGVDNTAVSATFNGLKSKDSYPSFNFGNMGMVFKFDNSPDSPFKRFQLSFGINRLMNFNSHTSIERNNLPSSFIDDNVLNTITSANDDFITSGVVDLDTNNMTISSVFENGTFKQIKTIRESGYLNEFSMSLSTNYENWLYLGMTLGIPFGNYTCKTSFSEERFVSGQSTGYYNYNTEQRLSASGINLKLGAIARPADWLRLGVAVHTPTYYTVDDEFYSAVEYNKYAGGWWPMFTYNMQSPWRFIGSLALILGNNQSKVSGTISMDYEYADYSSMQIFLENDTRTELALNNSIEKVFGSANTLRLGGELKYGHLRARGGYAHFGNPYEDSDLNDRSWNYVTFGVGYKGKTYSFDLSYAYGKNSGDKNYMYNNDSNPAVDISTTKNLIQATLGIRF